MSEIRPELDKRKNMYQELGLKMNVCPVIVGEDEDAIQQSYVSVNSVDFMVSSPFQAIDLAFKMSFALDADYPKECCREWLFLQQAVYGIFTPSDKKYSDMRSLTIVDEYKRFKETH